MYLEEAVFKHLTCSQCSKYLSISPIKVYPDRSIKCGRCGKADDGGVESQLYNLIIKDAIFPCVNSFDGCPEMRTLSTMSAHEQTCRTEEYSCQLCAAFVGSASSLYFHCKNNHPAQSLDNSEFLVDVDKDGRDIRYFYSSGRKLFFISGRYESSRSEININLSYFGKHFKGDMKYTLRFKTIEGTILYGSKQYPCSIMHQEMAEAIKYTVDTSNLPKNILICTFNVYEKPALVYNEIPSIIDPSSGYYLIKCPFHGLIDTFNCPTDQKELRLDFPAVFYFKNMAWSVFVKRKRCLTDLRRKIGIYLQWDNSFPDSDPIENCNVHVAFRIISVVASQTINRVVGDMNLTTGQKCYANVDWDAIANPKMGFVIDGIINVEVLLKIYSCHKRMVKCEDCNRPCVYC